MTTEQPLIVELTCLQGSRPQVSTTMIGEVSGPPGLAIVPELDRRSSAGDRCAYTGGWQIRHLGSGKVVPYVCLGGMGLGHAREALDLLADLPVDWTASSEAVQEALHGCVEQFRHIRTRVQVAVDEEQPEQLLPSWQRRPPRWLLDTSDGETYVFETREDAEHERDDVDDGQIRREDGDPWTLRCATPTCREALTEDTEAGEFEAANLTPAEVTRVAEHYARWRELDEQHWLCHRCSHLFTAPVG